MKHKFLHKPIAEVLLLSILFTFIIVLSYKIKADGGYGPLISIFFYAFITFSITLYKIKQNTDFFKTLKYNKCSGWITWLKALIIPVIAIYFSAESKISGVFGIFENMPFLHIIPSMNEILFILLLLIPFNILTNFDKYSLQKTNDQIQSIIDLSKLIKNKLGLRKPDSSSKKE